MKAIIEIDRTCFLLRQDLPEDAWGDLLGIFKGARLVESGCLGDYSRRVLVDRGEREVAIRLRPDADEVIPFEEYRRQAEQERKEREAKAPAS